MNWIWLSNAFEASRVLVKEKVFELMSWKNENRKLKAYKNLVPKQVQLSLSLIILWMVPGNWICFDNEINWNELI